MVGVRLGNLWWGIGPPDFVHSFFSTISHNLEPRFGKRFPRLMKGLYAGRLRSKHASAALVELAAARKELASFPPDRVIYDMKNLHARPPWGPSISPEITDLSNYFVTSDGRDLFGVLEEAIRELERDESDLALEMLAL